MLENGERRFPAIINYLGGRVGKFSGIMWVMSIAIATKETDEKPAKSEGTMKEAFDRLSRKLDVMINLLLGLHGLLFLLALTRCL